MRPTPTDPQGSAPDTQIAQFRSDGVSATTGLRLPFFTDAFSRASGFPDLRLVNLVTESTPNREERPYAAFVGLREIRYSRPGLVTGLNLGTGPIRGMFNGPAAFAAQAYNNQWQIVVSGSQVYVNTIPYGTIVPNTGPHGPASPVVLTQRSTYHTGLPSSPALDNSGDNSGTDYSIK